MTDALDVCVVGGGISGLSFAYFCAKAGFRVTVLEKEPRPGGALHSVPLEGGGVLELGAHTLYNSYVTVADLLDSLGLKAHVVARRGLQFKLLENRQAHSLFSRLSRFELVTSVPKAFFTSKEGRTTGQYYSRILGKRNYARLFRPMVRAVVSQNPDEFPAQVLFKRRRRRRHDLPRSFALEGGMRTLVDALSKSAGIDLRLHSAVTTIEARGQRFGVHLEGAGILEADWLALATPPERSARFLRGAHPDIADVLAEIPSASISSWGTAFRQPLSHLPRTAGLVIDAPGWLSAVSADLFPVPGKRAFTFHAEGTQPNPLTAGDIAQLLGVAGSDIEEVYRKLNTLPSLRPGHAARIARLDRAVSGSHLSLLGNYFFGLSIEDCVSRSHSEFLRMKEALAARS